MVIKKFNDFMNNDTIIEILIILEDIQKKLKKGVCPMKITNENPIVFEYHAGAIYTDLIGKNFKRDHHYEKVSISLEDNEIIMKWLDVVDDDGPHYTPNELKFNNVDDIQKFLNARYLQNKWSIRKVKNGRYLTNDGIDDIPQSMR